MTSHTRTFQTTPALPHARPRLLLVEDEAQAARVFKRALEVDCDVTVATDGIKATVLLQEQSFDIVLTDVVMPGISGVELLRLIRSYDLEVPVLLMTAAPDLAGAVQAVDLGAIGYLEKPFSLDELKRRVARGLSLGRFGRVKREALEIQGPVTPARVYAIGDRAGLEVQLDKALAGIHLAYQPIVSISEKRIVAYEALMRSGEPPLATPLAILEAAERIDGIRKVTERVTDLAAQAMVMLPEGATLYVNVHAQDLLDDFLERCALAPHASRVVLEITERGTVDSVPHLSARAQSLRGVGYRLAVDDLGAGYAGLTTFASVEPEVVKIDMSLVRDIDASVVRQRIVHMLVQLSRELSMTVVAEGIETIREMACLTDLGCDLAQGFLLARPNRMFLSAFAPW